MSARDIASPDRSGQAEPRVISYANRIIFVLERHDHGHWPEDFFLRDLGLRVGIVEHCRLDEKPSGQSAGSRLTTSQELRACGSSAIDHFQNAPPRFLGNDWAKLRQWI